MAHSAAVQLFDEGLERRVGAVDRDHVGAMVLFIPGFMQRGDAWRPVAELLPERYPSTMLDHVEHSFEGRLGEIGELPARDVLVGYSLGGRLALRAALRSPESFRAVVLVGSTAGMEKARCGWPGRGRREARILDGGDADRTSSGSGSAGRCSPTSPDALVEAQRTGRLSTTALACAAPAHRRTGVLEPVSRQLARSSCRCSRSPARATTATPARRSASHQPRRTAGWPSSRTPAMLPILQQPEAVAALITGFLDDLTYDQAPVSVDERGWWKTTTHAWHARSRAPCSNECARPLATQEVQADASTLRREPQLRPPRAGQVMMPLRCARRIALRGGRRGLGR